MFVSLHTIDKYQELYAKPTQDAEKKLIKPLLENKFFSKPNLQILLTNYALQKPPDKSHTICEIMRHLWPKKIRNELFKKFKEFDDFLIAVGKRDHFLHQFLVFLIGLHVIELILKKYKNAEDRMRLFQFNDEKYIFYTWLMAATTHDFGYPIEVASSISSNLSELYNSWGMQYLSKIYGFFNTKPKISDEDRFDKIEINKISSHYFVKTKEELNFNAVLIDQVSKSLNITKKSAKSLLGRLLNKADHGYLGAQILGRTVLNPFLDFHNRDWNKVKDTKLYQALLKASAAIAIHNFKWRRDRKRIDLEANFYAYVLFFIDNIQDWSRYSTTAAKWPRFWLADFSTDASNQTIKIDYKLHHNSWNSSMEKRVKRGLKEKREAVMTLKNPKNKLGIKIEVTFKNLYPKIEESITHLI